MGVQRLERIQERATKLIPAIRYMGYQRGLKALGLFSLETRRLRRQLIELFKILQGFYNIDYRHLFSLNMNAIRNYEWRLSPPRYSCDKVGDFLTYKIYNTWNRLPKNVVNSSSVEQFKSQLDKVLDMLV
ncbi:uncharacterized protein LOC143018685 [Oratosquilla oratoria]|uniref:uncharacterized protein LOC143018685 n=1 Tax=Oratosquilla oratoria TaxID=337810 RepID=UPI003F75FE7F